MLADEDVLRAVLDGIAHGRSAEAAWWDSVEAMAKRYRSAWTRFAFALKDRLEAGREPGVKPVGEAAED
jgi:acyl carrier protein phosphodiesterase